MINKDKKGKDEKIKDEILNDLQKEDSAPEKKAEASKDDAPSLEQELEKYKTELALCVSEAEKYKALSEEYKLMAQRERADFENYKKRNASLRADAYDDGVKECITLLLPVIDNFERAIKVSEEKADIDFIIEGLKSIYKQIWDYLKSVNVTEIPALDCQFDPLLHNAVLHTQEENAPENTVTEVMQKGYLYKDKVLRHSMVKVIN